MKSLGKAGYGAHRQLQRLDQVGQLIPVYVAARAAASNGIELRVSFRLLRLRDLQARFAWRGDGARIVRERHPRAGACKTDTQPINALLLNSAAARCRVSRTCPQASILPEQEELIPRDVVGVSLLDAVEHHPHALCPLIPRRPRTRRLRAGGSLWRGALEGVGHVLWEKTERLSAPAPRAYAVLSACKHMYAMQDALAGRRT